MPLMPRPAAEPVAAPDTDTPATPPAVDAWQAAEQWLVDSRKADATSEPPAASEAPVEPVTTETQPISSSPVPPPAPPAELESERAVRELEARRETERYRAELTAAQARLAAVERLRAPKSTDDLMAAARELGVPIEQILAGALDQAAQPAAPVDPRVETLQKELEAFKEAQVARDQADLARRVEAEAAAVLSSEPDRWSVLSAEAGWQQGVREYIVQQAGSGRRLTYETAMDELEGKLVDYYKAQRDKIEKLTKLAPPAPPAAPAAVAQPAPTGRPPLPASAKPVAAVPASGGKAKSADEAWNAATLWLVDSRRSQTR